MLPTNFEWISITRAEFDYALEIVPPVRFSSTWLFLRGEAQDVDEAGRSRLWAAPGRRAKLHLHFDGGWQNDLDIYEFGREHGLLAERVRNTPEAREHVLATMDAAGWSLQHVDDGARSWSPKEAKSKTAGSKKASKKPTAKKASKA